MQHLTGFSINAGYPRHYRSTRSLVSRKSIENTVVRDGYLKDKVTVNVSGTIYETLESTLDKYPETLLGTSKKRAFLLNQWKNEIFLNRSRPSFEAILFYYQSCGNLIRPECVSMKDFVEECEFYEISDSAIKDMKSRECYLYRKKLHIPPRNQYNAFLNSCWTFFDHPRNFQNITATIYGTFSVFLILVSVATFCLETELFLAYDGAELTEYVKYCRFVELVLNIYFAIEFAIRLIVYPNPKCFFKRTINVFELCSIYLYLIIYTLPDSTARSASINATRIARTLRIVRVGRLSRTIETSTYVLFASLDDVYAVCFVSLILCIFAGSIMYYIEQDQPGTQFTSIPQSMWWSMQSLFCLGYGDIVPETLIGKTVGSFVVFLGVVTVTVLLLSLGGRLFDMYSKELYKISFLPENLEKKSSEIKYTVEIMEKERNF